MSRLKELKVVFARTFLAGLLSGAACANPIEVGIAQADAQFLKDDVTGALRSYQATLSRLQAKPSPAPTDAAFERYLLTRLGEISGYYRHDTLSAVQQFATLVRKHPKAPEARLALERLADLEHFKLGRLPEAQTAYRQIVQQFATTEAAPKAQLALVSVALKLGDFALAKEEAEKILRRWPNREEARRARFEIGDTLARERRYSEAIAAYEALIAERPNSKLAALARFEVATALEASGETASALPYYYAALAKHPSPALVQHKIGRVRARIHNTLPTSAITNARAQARQRSTLPKGL